MPKFTVPKFNLASKPAIPNIKKFKILVAKKIGNLEKVKPPNYEDLYRKYYKEIIAAWQKSKSLTSLSPKVFNKIPVVAILSFNDKPKLIDDSEFRQAWLALMAERKHARHARKIYRAVLRNYNSYQSHLEHVFGYIKPLIRNATLRSCKKLASLDDRYGMMRPEMVKNIADNILAHKEEESSDNILSAMGIAGSLREAEISAAVGVEILARNRDCLQDGDDSMLARALEYFKNDANAEPTLRFKDRLNDILTSLLGNYLKQDPPANIKKQIEDFTDKYLGDPRANPKWSGVDEEIKQVVVRWKIGVTLRAFFELLDYVARFDPTHDRHWRERKEFWQGYLDKGKITGAWVVLGRKYFDHHDFLNVGNLKFGKFSKQVGIQSSHCAIIMQINNFVLTEWSHVGGLRIWKADNRRAPQLYQDAYHPDRLKNIKHYDRKGYVRHDSGWQNKARKKLDGEEVFRRW